MHICMLKQVTRDERSEAQNLQHMASAYSLDKRNVSTFTTALNKFKSDIASLFDESLCHGEQNNLLGQVHKPRNGQPNVRQIQILVFETISNLSFRFRIDFQFNLVSDGRFLDSIFTTTFSRRSFSIFVCSKQN